MPWRILIATHHSEVSVKFAWRDELPQHTVKASVVRVYFHVLTKDKVIEFPHRCSIVSRRTAVSTIALHCPSFRVPVFGQALLSLYRRRVQSSPGCMQMGKCYGEVTYLSKTLAVNIFSLLRTCTIPGQERQFSTKSLT